MADPINNGLMSDDPQTQYFFLLKYTSVDEVFVLLALTASNMGDTLAFITSALTAAQEKQGRRAQVLQSLANEVEQLWNEANAETDTNKQNRKLPNNMFDSETRTGILIELGLEIDGQPIYTWYVEHMGTGWTLNLSNLKRLQEELQNQATASSNSMAKQQAQAANLANNMSNMVQAYTEYLKKNTSAIQTALSSLRG